LDASSIPTREAKVSHPKCPSDPWSRSRNRAATTSQRVPRPAHRRPGVYPIRTMWQLKKRSYQGGTSDDSYPDPAKDTTNTMPVR